MLLDTYSYQYVNGNKYQSLLSVFNFLCIYLAIAIYLDRPVRNLFVHFLHFIIVRDHELEGLGHRGHGGCGGTDQAG